MSYLTVDLETYGHKTYKRFCNPLDPAHYVVAIAYKHCCKPPQVLLNKDGFKEQHIFTDIDLSDVKVMIGQNFKFDMLWFWRNRKFRQWLKDGGQIWDTMLAEFLLRGQRGRAHGGSSDDSISLDALAKKYGGTLKDKDVSHIFKSGGTVLDIPDDQLIEYAKGDVNNTELVFFGQVEQAKKEGMLDIIKAYNNHLLAVTEMEYNGLKFNVPRAHELNIKLKQKLEDIEEQFLFICKDVWPQDLIPLNIGSTQHLAALFFGGTLTATIKEEMLDGDGEVIRFKSGQKVGQIRTRNVVTPIRIEGLGEICLPEFRTPRDKPGTSDTTLKALKKEHRNASTLEIVECILEYRKIKKLQSTYVEPFIELVHPDGCIHTEYNVVETFTGRLSSLRPNVQNLHPNILDLIESRYMEGSIVELDFSQLEVVVQAWITDCKRMLQDIEDGVDFHCLRLSYAEEMDYDKVVKLCASEAEWKNKRKKAKIISFQRAYGAGEQKISDSTGLSVEVIQKVFETENQRYPEIKAFYDDLTESIHSYEIDQQQKVRLKSGKSVLAKNLKQKRGEFRTVTGKKYSVDQKVVETQYGLFKYWPGPSVQNYPIQGTAADIVAIQVGRVFRFLLEHEDKAKLINEVHDSCILDVKDEHKDFIIENVERILNDVKGGFDSYLKIKFDAPIHVDYGVGKTWKEAK